MGFSSPNHPTFSGSKSTVHSLPGWLLNSLALATIIIISVHYQTTLGSWTCWKILRLANNTHATNSPTSTRQSEQTKGNYHCKRNYYTDSFSLIHLHYTHNILLRSSSSRSLWHTIRHLSATSVCNVIRCDHPLNSIHLKHLGRHNCVSIIWAMLE